MKLLVIVPSYPNIGSAAYQFVHDRVKEYKKEMEVDVFCLDKNFKSHYTFEGVEVYGGTSETFSEYLLSNNYDKYAYFFLSSSIARFIIRNMKKEKIFIFYMGSDCVTCRRRFVKSSNGLKAKLKDLVKKRILLFFEYLKIINIKKINKKVNDCTFVFVSKWSKENSEKDFKIKYNKFEIIPNYVDSDVFKYKVKKAEERLNVLSIKSYSSMVYAGDILQDIIIEFSKHMEFKYFTFNLYGFGKLFKEQTKNLKKFKNVYLKECVLSHDEIVDIQNHNGVLLYPKRGDSQGVSRCEAMICGLVPIASDSEAISEYTPKNTGYLANSIQGFIDALLYIYNNPKDYLDKSKEGSKFIKEKCSYKNTIEKEIIMLRGK